jgi:hypothetical protein
MVNDKPIESGTERTTDEYLDKYILLHCAKLELTLLDVSSGRYLGNVPESYLNSVYQRERDLLMKIIAK